MSDNGAAAAETPVDSSENSGDMDGITLMNIFTNSLFIVIFGLIGYCYYLDFKNDSKITSLTKKISEMVPSTKSEMASSSKSELTQSASAGISKLLGKKTSE